MMMLAATDDDQVQAINNCGRLGAYFKLSWRVEIFWTAPGNIFGSNFLL